MIDHPAFTIEPWSLRAEGLDVDVLAQAESVFALSNGHIGWRGNLDEGEPHGLPGSYLSGVYELRPLPYAEAGYGYPESGQTVINVTNGKLIRLLVDDEPLDVRYGTIDHHERELDFRTGLLKRTIEWTSPAGQAVRVTSTRMISFVQRSIAAIRYEVEALDEPARIVVQSELVANEQLPTPDADPRVAAALESPLVAEAHVHEGARVGLVHRTQESGLRVAVAMDHLVEGPAHRLESDSSDDVGQVTVTTALEPGQKLTLVKFVAYGWSGARSLPGVRAQVDAALTLARQTGWDGLVAEQRSYLDEFWDCADIEVEGDTEIQQAVRFAVFQVLQAGARAEGRAIAAKGLTGPGYDGHAFWDTESFVVPVLVHTSPHAACHALRWRHSTLPMARDRAAQLGFEGAVFPWRTIAGEECSAYWPAGTAAFHVNADIADAVLRYVRATADEWFERTVGLELLVETARLWRSLGHHDDHGGFRIDGVTGPDEYSAVADNNVYTNLMAQRNLRGAADAASRWRDEARALDVDEEETASWRDAADNMRVPFDRGLGVHAQSEGFTDHQAWDFARMTDADYPLLLHVPYVDLYRKQVVKQADLVLAMQFCSESFTPEEKLRNFDYYERITVRDSSLSAAAQAVLAAEVGHLSLAFDYLGEAALMDLDDLEHNTRDGIHIASLSGVWSALVSGFGGMRLTSKGLCFSPRLPEGLNRLAFSVLDHGQRIHVVVTSREATYTLDDGDPVDISHHGGRLSLTAGQAATRPIHPIAPLPAPRQPPGRAPRHRGAARSGTDEA